MNLFPQDLGEKRCRTLAARRSGRSSSVAEDTPAIGSWGRVWLGKQKDLWTPVEAQAALYSARKPARTWTALSFLPILPALALAISSHEPSFVLLDCLMLGGWMWLSAIIQPRKLLARTYRRIHDQAVTSSEIAALLPEAHDELERSYLTLVMDVVRQEIAPAQAQGPASGTDLRSALRALGDAIDKLPATRVVGNLALGSETPDIMTEVLRRTAVQTLLLAQNEPDRVVAASLIRRVEALHRRADATARANVLVRRFSVLRQEMAAETEALRAGLAAYYTGTHDFADLTQLAQEMQRVAAEAAAMTAAVEEVDAWMLGAPARPAVPAEAPQARMQLGQG